MHRKELYKRLKHISENTKNKMMCFMAGRFSWEERIILFDIENIKNKITRVRRFIELAQKSEHINEKTDYAITAIQIFTFKGRRNSVSL